MSAPAATSKQLDFIAELCDQTGIQMPMPKSIGEAKKQIKSLLAIRQKPTQQQLGYIKFLAGASDLAFEQPKTQREAREVIAQLQASLELSEIQDVPAEASLERRESYLQADHHDESWLNATAFREDETHGYGSSARWA